MKIDCVPGPDINPSPTHLGIIAGTCNASFIASDYGSGVELGTKRERTTITSLPTTDVSSELLAFY